MSNEPDNDTEAGFDTLQLHAGQRPDPTTGSRAVPIFQTSSYVFDSADHAEALFAGNAKGNQYGRMHNPTVQVFADRIAALEGGAAAVALSSGQAATTAVLLAIARPGAEVVVSSEIFGGTFAVARKILEPWGCRVRAVAPDPAAIRDAIGADTVGVWVETIANPSNTVPDLAAIAEVTREARVPFIVDNTWGCGGYICRPIELGADAVVHSATKWIGGHGTLIAGAVVDAGTFVWDEARFPAFHAPDSRGRSYLDKRPDAPLAARVSDLGLFTMGMTLSPHTAFLALQGLETLSLRVQRCCDTAQALAEWLEDQAGVSRVLYAGLPSHPSFDAARRTLRNGSGAVVALELGSQAAARAFLDALELVSHLANIGDAKTVAIHPWTTTHAGLSHDDRRKAGVSPELIRLSVGLESREDLQADLARAIARAAGADGGDAGAPGSGGPDTVGAGAASSRTGRGDGRSGSTATTGAAATGGVATGAASTGIEEETPAP